MIALERLDRARARGARVYATIDGYASTCDAYHRVQMDPDGEQIVRCMTEALRRAGRPAEAIGYVNYHGTSTQLNDTIEAMCTRRVFGAHADRVPGSSTKSMIGHPQGASGAAGVVTTALALSEGFLPPTINLTDQDPAVRSGLSPQRRPRRAAGGGTVQLPRIRIEELGARARRGVGSRCARSRESARGAALAGTRSRDAREGRGRSAARGCSTASDAAAARPRAQWRSAESPSGASPRAPRSARACASGATRSG